MSGTICGESTIFDDFGKIFGRRRSTELQILVEPTYQQSQNVYGRFDRKQIVFAFESTYLIICIFKEINFKVKMANSQNVTKRKFSEFILRFSTRIKS